MNYDAEVEVRIAEDLTFGDIAPLLDAFAGANVFRVGSTGVA